MRALPILTALVGVWMGLPVLGQAPTLSHELVHVGDEGHTYRVYANFNAPGDHLTAIYASSSEPAEATSNNGFYQHPLGGPMSTGANPFLLDIYPELAYDSWFTIGAETSTDNALNSAGSSDWQTSLTNWEAGGNWSQSGPFGGSFYVLPTDAQGQAGEDLQVLVAQWTVTAAVHSVWNLQWRAEGSSTSQEVGQIELDIPAPSGCTDPTALNHISYALTDDGSCLYPDPSYIGLAVEEVTDAVGTPEALGRTWRIYAEFGDAEDELTSVFGTADHGLSLTSTLGFHQDPVGSALAENSAAALSATPSLAWDSWVTLGAAEAPTGVQTVGLDLANFEAGGDLTSDDTFGGSWYVYPGQNEAAHPDADGRVLLAQVTTQGVVNAAFNLQYRSMGTQSIFVFNESITFPTAFPGCMDPTACNFDLTATEDDGSCVAPGCGDPEACNYDPDALCTGGECIPNGCPDPTACNYNPLATCGTLACIPSGCMDADACNFNPLAQCDGEACDYTCCPGPGCCGEGTYWDELQQRCIPDNIPIEIVAGIQEFTQLYNDIQDLANQQSMRITQLEASHAECTGETAPTVLADLPCGDAESLNYNGYDYDLVSIGDQCWFAENLRTESDRSGNAIPQAEADGDWSDAHQTSTGVWCHPGGDPAKSASYGHLYNHWLVMGGTEVCPTGWHVPTDADFLELEVFMGMPLDTALLTDWRGVDEGVRLKASPTDVVPWDGTNEVGFRWVQGGWRHVSGSYGYTDDLGLLLFTPSAESGANLYGFRQAGNQFQPGGLVRTFGGNAGDGRSIRCIQD